MSLSPETSPSTTSLEADVLNGRDGWGADIGIRPETGHVVRTELGLDCASARHPFDTGRERNRPGGHRAAFRGFPTTWR
jgi:hypothetical protein